MTRHQDDKEQAMFRATYSGECAQCGAYIEEDDVMGIIDGMPACADCCRMDGQDPIYDATQHEHEHEEQ